MTFGVGRPQRKSGDGGGGGGSEMLEGGEPEREIRPPPDGGWGWVVVFASFMIHIVADGVTYTFGIFFVEFANYFEEGKGATSWIASILVGVTLGCGPIASALTNKYGCRMVTVLGSVIATFGFVISLFAPNITTLYFTIGVCVGVGFGFIYLPAIVSVTCFFEKRRAFATGIAVCGSGLGTFIFAPVTELLVETYGWKGAMLLVAGFVLNCAVFGALFRAPEEEDISKQKEILLEKGGGRGTPSEIGMLKQVLKRSVTAHGQLTADIDDDNNQINPPRRNGYLFVDVGRDQHGGMKCWSAQNLTQQATAAPIKREGSSRSLVWKERSQDPSLVAGPLYRKDIFYRGSLLNLPQYRSNPSMYTASVTHIPPSDPEARGGRSMISLSRCFGKEARDAFTEMMDFSLLADPVFLLFAISNFCTSIGFNVPYVYIKDRALLLGMSSDESSFLIAIIGISNTISRVILGYISDKSWLNRLWLYNGSLIICGLSTALSAFCQDYPSQAFYAVVFGATAGAYVGLTSVILVDLLGLERLTNAFGLLLLFQGIAALIGPPIAGWLYDSLHSYDPGFFVAGSMIAISGAMLFLISFVRKRSSCVEDRKLPSVTVEGGGVVLDGDPREEEEEEEEADRPLEMTVPDKRDCQ